MSYNFVQDAKFYYNLYDKSRESGKLSEASQYLLEAIRLGRSMDYKIELASLYAEMGQLDMSNEECYAVLSKDRRNNDCLNILSNNFTEKKNYRAAYYYFSKFDAYGIDDFSDLLTSDSVLGDYNRLGFKLVWSKGVKDCSDVKEEAEIYLAMKSYKEAAASLNRISGNSPQYGWARKMLVFCYYMIGDYQQALEITEELLSKSENDISIMSVAYNILFETGQSEKAKIIADKIAVAECNEVGDVLKAGYCMMDSKRYKDAVTILEREMPFYPYDDGVMLLLSSAYYLVGSEEKAKKILLKLINIYGDRTYAKFFLESIKKKEFNDSGIAYGIPATKALKMNASIEKNLKTYEKFNKAFMYDADFKSVLKWRILTDSSDDLSYDIICSLGFIKNSSAIKFLEELLLKEKVTAEAKVNILSQIINIGGKKREAFVNESYFRIVNTVNPRETTPYFIDAYSMCCVYLAPMLKDYENEIYCSFTELNILLKEEKKKMYSSEALAALILYRSDKLEISKDKKIIAGLFGAFASGDPG
jgi:tetratricopeptide (TPR) repeat protein